MKISTKVREGQFGDTDDPASSSPNGASRGTNVLSHLPIPLNGGRQRSLRIALYAHDTMGLGHTRRNLLIAQALSGNGVKVDTLLITGNRETGTFPMPPRTDYLSMPAIHKAEDGRYGARRLDISLQDLITLRSNLILAALESFQPDVFIVDNVPRGAVGELDAALAALRKSGRTHVVLGLRDILDAVPVVQREWRNKRNFETIRRFYDRVWVFGDPAVFDPVTEYSFPADVAARVRYAGYLDQRARLELESLPDHDPLAELGLPEGKLAVCFVGGGQDGSYLAEMCMRSTLPENTNGVIVTGPFMPAETRERLYLAAEQNPRLGVLDFIPEPGLLMQRADHVVTMGGYNTVSDVLSHSRRALIVPRVRPRLEQHIRADRLASLGLVDMCHPDDLTPETLSQWLAEEPGLQRNHFSVDLGGVRRLPRLLEELLSQPAGWLPEQQVYEEQYYAAF